MDRGQTLHDYVAGISVFVLTIGVVLGLLPGVIAPFSGDGTAVDASTATRITGQIVGNHSVADTETTLNESALGDVFALDEEDLRSRYGLGPEQHVNLTLTGLDGTPLHDTAGATAAGEDTSSASRVIELQPPGTCSPACRLTVRVW
ncbi:MAG: hypothetical protein ABEH64_11110 [Salinirussus sp.]